MLLPVLQQCFAVFCDKDNMRFKIVFASIFMIVAVLHVSSASYWTFTTSKI